MPFENAGSWRGSFEPGTVAFERSESVLRTESIGTSSTLAYTIASVFTHLTTSLVDELNRKVISMKEKIIFNKEFDLEDKFIYVSSPASKSKKKFFYETVREK